MQKQNRIQHLDMRISGPLQWQYLMLKRIEARGQVMPHKSTQTIRPNLLPTRVSRLDKIRDLTRAFSGVTPVGVLPRLLITSALTLVSIKSK